MPVVSVILPTRDRAALLPRAVASVRAQTETSWELILIDNNRAEPPVADSAHGQEWAEDPRVRIIRVPHAANAAAARNAGLALAQGEFVAYLDDDDAYRPEKLARQLAAMRRHGAAISLCGATYHLAGRTRGVQCDTSSWSGDDLLLRARWGTPFLLHRACPAQRFDETLSAAEDLEFSLRLVRVFGAETVPVVAEPLVDVFPQPGPRVNTASAPRRRAAARVLALHRGRFARSVRRRFVLQTLLAMAKLSRQRRACLALSWRLLRESRGADWRLCANACAFSLGLFPARWIT